MQTKKKTKLKQSRKNKKLQKGGANYTMSHARAGRLPDTGDVYVGTRYDPYPLNILGGEWYPAGRTRDGWYKFRWNWKKDEPTCGPEVGKDDRLWCQNSGVDQASKDNWCRTNGWDCLRCASSGYCTHEPRPGEDYYDDDSEWEEAPEEAYDPQDPIEVARGLEDKKKELEEDAKYRRKRLPCNPVPRTCDEVPIEDGKECLGGRCSACENNEDITDPIDLEIIPTGKGVCIDRKCYNMDTLRETLRHMPELPLSRKPFTLDDLDNALQQVICIGESKDPGSSSSSIPGQQVQTSTYPGPSSSSDYPMDDVGSEIEELKQQAQQIQIQLKSLSSIQTTLEDEIRGYRNIYSMLEQDITMFREQYNGIISDAQLIEIIEAKQRNLLDINETILNLQRQLDVQKRQKQELQDNLAAIIIVLQEHRVYGQDGGKKYRKNRKNTKKYKNKIIKTKNKKNTKKYKNNKK